MKNVFSCFRWFASVGIFLLACGGDGFRVHANPVPVAVNPVTQGTATINGSGTSQVTINQTSPNAFINWASFNLAPGETTTFNQPSASSVTWNYIADPLASSINGNINANGYVVLQNPNGFSIGGQASITAHGLVMTTASTPAFNFSSGGPWSFSTPPPAAKIINYGIINISGGGSAFLIANDIENNGTISAPGGNVGLYAGQSVLVSMSPDGRGLSAQVTIPEGLVDNNGNLIADAGSVTLQAQMVNQNGLIQANSAQNVNGTIELIAGNPGNVSDPVNANATINLGANSIISANGDSTAATPSSGGLVTIQSGNSFADQSGSTINVSGASQGGSGGQVTISAPQMNAINSTINGQAAANYANASLSIDTTEISLNADDSPVAGALSLNVKDLSSGLSQISLQAANNIELSSSWILGNPCTVSLQAGNTITVDPAAGIEANAGKIVLTAPTVYQNGILQADSVGGVNGAVEIDAGTSLNLGASSVISANGDPVATSASPGGFVVLNAGNNSFNDTVGSAISTSGTSGGQNGIIEIFGNGVTANTIQSTIGSYLAYLINPDDVYLSTSTTTPSTTSDGSHPNPYANFNVNDLSVYSQIDLAALNNIELDSDWTLGNQTVPAVLAPWSNLSLSAGNNITLKDSLYAGDNWNVNLTAGTAFIPTPGQPTLGSAYGISLTGSAALQTINGDITLNAANGVSVAGGMGGGIRTIDGGNISVTAVYGDVNTGNSPDGFNYLSQATAPYYTPFNVESPGTLQESVEYNLSQLGGISTAAGGNVTINAGGNVTSFPAATVAAADSGTGAFGAEPGNVTINAGGNVYGHFVEVNGTGTINAQNIGTALQNVALSLVNGGWNLNAQENIYLQEVRNPNGVFNSATTTVIVNRRPKIIPAVGDHLFDYNPLAWVDLTAGNGVYVTGNNLPRPAGPVPLLLPPTVIINAGPGGISLQTPTATDGTSVNDVPLSANYGIVLFPSPYQSLQITTTGGGWLSSGNGDGTDTTLLMSDSGLTQWYNNAVSGGLLPFGPQDHASVPALLNNNEPVMINLNGSQIVNGIPVLAGMENIILQTDKATQINIAGDMIGCSFYGENLQASGPGSVTSITVGGQIFNAGSFTSVTLNEELPTLPFADIPFAKMLPPGTSVNSWYLALALAIDPNNPAFTQSYSSPALAANGISTSTKNPYLFQDDINGFNTSLAYNPNTKTLTAIGPLSSTLLPALQSQTLTVVRYDSDGLPALDANGHIVLDSITWVPDGSVNAALISTLNTESNGPDPSHKSVPLNGAAGAYVVGGTGEFDVTAGSISLGNSRGILSVGSAGTLSSAFLNQAYSFLAPYITSGANINVQVRANLAIPDATGSLEMPASTIASLAGGNVTVFCNGEIPNSPLNNNGVGVSMDLGSQALLDFETQIMTANNLGLGIYATGGGDVSVTAVGTINIDSSRIATFNGGDVNVESLTGDIIAGTGGTSVVPVQYFAPNYSGSSPVEFVPANGVVAGTLTAARQIPPGSALLPGNITVSTPQGSIYADLGGISQVAYDETLSSASGYTAITLNAGSDGYVGDIVLGSSGVIGVNVNATATGKITGLIISQQNADISAAESFAGTVLAGGKATLSSSGTISGTIVAIGGVNTSGGGNLTATVLSSSVNGGAGTLATSSSASSASQSATSQASSQAQQQVASNDNGNDDEKKKKKAGLSRSVGHVTVILPKTS